MSRGVRIAIIGAGPAGCAAAVQCKRLGEEPVLIDQSGRAGGLVSNAYSIENYPGLEPVSGPDFVRLLDKHIKSFGISVLPGSVQRVTHSGREFALSGDLEELKTRALIVAVGTRHRDLTVPGAKEALGNGLYYDVVDVDAEVKKSIVVGGGEAALDYALTLARFSEVTILVRGNSLRAKGRLVRLVEQADTISITHDVEILSIKSGALGIIASVVIQGEKSNLGADVMVAAIGREERATELLKGLDVGPLGAVSTRIPGLFVAGDARTGTLGQVGMAVGDGLDAAMAAVRFLD